jgi:CO dehydrogenase/acetyl-CoA synthase beta subunit
VGRQTDRQTEEEEEEEEEEEAKCDVECARSHGLETPRIAMHMCAASITTATPCAAAAAAAIRIDYQDWRRRRVPSGVHGRVKRVKRVKLRAMR